MLKIIILIFALILLTAAQPSTPIGDDIKLKIPFLNETDLENPSYRVTPFILKDKIYAVNAFIKVNWFVAQQICSYQGMTLASINSAVESERLRRHLVENGLTSQNEAFWTSGNDLGTQGQWVWFSNGLPLIYKNWAPGEPNNQGDNERCLQVIQDGSHWNDYICDREAYFICENRCALDSYSVPIYPNL